MSNRALLPLALKAIRELRAEADPSFAIGSFGPKVGISAAHLCNIEAGRKRATPESIFRFAYELGISPDAISYPVQITTEATA
jgi:hypothetical protein